MPLDPTELFPEFTNLFEFPSVHAEMVYDLHRVNAYQRAIERIVKPGDVIVDVGTGTGLLAFLCVQAGASRVHAIDRSPIIRCAEALARVNSLNDQIMFHYADSRDTDIGEQVDVVISELIGHMAFEEGMVEALCDAKRRFLKPGGSMIPQSVTLYAAPVFEREVYGSCVDRWKPAYGIEYSFMRDRALRTSYVADISDTDLVAECQPIFQVDFDSNIVPDDHVERTYRVYRTGQVNGVALWFDAILAKGVRLSSDPWSKTHWKQCFAPIDHTLSVSTGDRLRVYVNMKLSHQKGDPFMFSVTVSKEEIDAP